MGPKRTRHAPTHSKRVHTTPPPSKPPVELNETPLSKRVSGATPYTSMHFKRDARMNELGGEMKGKFAGPVPPSTFLNYFLPSRGITKPPPRNKKAFKVVAEKEYERAMYVPMITALKRYCTGFELVNTSAHPDTSVSKNEPEIKPDVSLYEKGRRTDPNVITDISLLDLHMEFKLDYDDDPFRDDGAFEHQTQQSADTRGQITAYTTKQLASQFRTHAFSVFICKDKARLIYWDRSGAVVTRLFSYVEERWLTTFFWRYTHLPPAFRGVDESVTTPTEADTAHVKRARAALQLDEDAPIFKFAVYDEERGDVSWCFGNEPWFKATGSLTGRATRVFIVYDPVINKRVLMKDTWRVSLPGLLTEGAIYKCLRAANVSQIPVFVRGGDVISPYCRTRSHGFARKFNLELRPHSHYRFMLEDIGHDLTSFRTTKELVEAMADALQAHTEAFEKAGILHRDISPGNIIISHRGGLLIDWDLSKHVDDLNKPSRQPYRTGTWQFIAARLLLAKESATHTPADDWESFFHVLSWVVLRFTRHGLDPAELTKELRNTYDDSYMNGGKVCGGENKEKSILSRYISSKAQVPPGPLLDLLKDLVDVCAVRYEEPPTEEAQERYEQAIARDPSITAIVSKDPSLAAIVLNVIQYRDRKEKLKASWLIERFRDAANSPAWDKGPTGQRVINQLIRIDVAPITKKRPSEFDTDIPSQNKKFKPMQDDGEVATDEHASETDDIEEADDVEEDEDVSDEDSDEVDDGGERANAYCGETDWGVDDDPACEDAWSSTDDERDELPMVPAA